MSGFNIPVASEGEVYAVREKIDFGNGEEDVVVIYPKNKIIPRRLADKALEELKKREANK